MKKRMLQLRADRILSYISVFERPGYSFGKWSDSEDWQQHFTRDETANRFVETLYEDGWMEPFDWGSWEPHAARFRRDIGALSRARVSTLQRLLCLHIRKDRFVEGHLAAMFESGDILRILRRLAELQSRAPRGAKRRRR